MCLFYCAWFLSPNKFVTRSTSYAEPTDKSQLCKSMGRWTVFLSFVSFLFSILINNGQKICEPPSLYNCHQLSTLSEPFISCSTTFRISPLFFLLFFIRNLKTILADDMANIHWLYRHFKCFSTQHGNNPLACSYIIVFKLLILMTVLY